MVITDFHDDRRKTFKEIILEVLPPKWYFHGGRDGCWLKNVKQRNGFASKDGRVLPSNTLKCQKRHQIYNLPLGAAWVPRAVQLAKWPIDTMSHRWDGVHSISAEQKRLQGTVYKENIPRFDLHLASFLWFLKGAESKKKANPRLAILVRPGWWACFFGHDITVPCSCFIREVGA